MASCCHHYQNLWFLPFASALRSLFLQPPYSASVASCCRIYWPQIGVVMISMSALRGTGIQGVPSRLNTDCGIEETFLGLVTSLCCPTYHLSLQPPPGTHWKPSTRLAFFPHVFSHLQPLLGVQTFIFLSGACRGIFTSRSAWFRHCLLVWSFCYGGTILENLG